VYTGLNDCVCSTLVGAYRALHAHTFAPKYAHSTYVHIETCIYSVDKRTHQHVCIRISSHISRAHSHPTRHSKEPYIHSKEPYMHSQKSYTYVVSHLACTHTHSHPNSLNPTPPPPPCDCALSSSEILFSTVLPSSRKNLKSVPRLHTGR